MDLEKKYQDSGGRHCNIMQMVIREQEWAANRIQEGEKAIERLSELAEVAELALAELVALQSNYNDALGLTQSINGAAILLEDAISEAKKQAR